MMELEYKNYYDFTDEFVIKYEYELEEQIIYRGGATRVYDLWKANECVGTIKVTFLDLLEEQWEE